MKTWNKEFSLTANSCTERCIFCTGIWCSRRAMWSIRGRWWCLHKNTHLPQALHCKLRICWRYLPFTEHIHIINPFINYYCLVQFLTKIPKTVVYPRFTVHNAVPFILCGHTLKFPHNLTPTQGTATDYRTCDLFHRLLWRLQRKADETCVSAWWPHFCIIWSVPRL